jgi:hypothetical protein
MSLRESGGHTGAVARRAWGEVDHCVDHDHEGHSGRANHQGRLGERHEVNPTSKEATWPSDHALIAISAWSPFV